jgi:hypothetical protein
VCDSRRLHFTTRHVQGASLPLRVITFPRPARPHKQSGTLGNDRRHGP